MKRTILFVWWFVLAAGFAGYCIGKHIECKRWEKATADVAWHCIEQHTGPAEPDTVVHPKTEEKTFMVPTEEDRKAALISAEQ
jgi:hypothetical protein